MRVVVVGLGVQGKKRVAVAGPDVVATVDPAAPGADHPSVERVPLDSYDAALVCTRSVALVGTGRTAGMTPTATTATVVAAAPTPAKWPPTNA